MAVNNIPFGGGGGSHTLYEGEGSDRKIETLGH